MLELDGVTADGWSNILTGLGRADRDKRLATTFGVPTVLDGASLDRLYAGDWRIARICDRPAGDQVRRWTDVVVEGRRDRSDEVHTRLRELGAKTIFGEGIAASRLHGTALAVVWVDDGLEMSEPLDLDRVRRVENIRVIDRWDLTVGTWVGDAGSPAYGLPETYRINSRVVDYRGEALAPLVHYSRVLRWDGVRTSRRRVLELGGWSDSVVSRVYDVVRDYAAAIGGVAHLTADFAQAVIKIKGLAKLLAEDKDQLVLQRLQVLDMARSLARLVPLDADAEEFERKTTPVAGLADLLDRLRDELCGAADMPEKLLFGKATAGLGDQGQSDLEQYYNGIETEQDRNVVPQASQLVAMLWAELGNEAPRWEVQPRALWTPSDKEISENRLRDAQADEVRIRNSIVTPDEIREARYGGDTYRTELQIETGDETPEVDDEIPGPTGPDDPTVDPDAPEGKLDPETTLNGAQISAAVDLVAKVITGEITVSAARVIARVGLGLKAGDITEMLQGVEEAIAEKQERGEKMQAQISGGKPPAPPAGKPPIPGNPGADPGAAPGAAPDADKPGET